MNQKLTGDQFGLPYVAS